MAKKTIGRISDAKSIFLFIFVVTIPVWLQAVNGVCSDTEENQLWKRAEAIAKANKHHIPGKILVTEIVKDNKGKTESETHIAVKSIAGPKQSLQWKVVKAIENGKDISSKGSRSILDELYDVTLDLGELHPFSEKSCDISIQLVSEAHIYKGRKCRIFTFKMPHNKQVWRGKIWIHTRTGIPLVMEIGAPSPFKDDGVDILEYKVKIEYSDDAANWFPLFLKEDITLKAKTFPFSTWKGTSESTVVFSDYWNHAKQLK